MRGVGGKGRVNIAWFSLYKITLIHALAHTRTHIEKVVGAAAQNLQISIVGTEEGFAHLQVSHNTILLGYHITLLHRVNHYACTGDAVVRAAVALLAGRGRWGQHHTHAHIQTHAHTYIYISTYACPYTHAPIVLLCHHVPLCCGVLRAGGNQRYVETLETALVTALNAAGTSQVGRASHDIRTTPHNTIQPGAAQPQGLT